MSRLAYAAPFAFWIVALSPAAAVEPPAANDTVLDALKNGKVLLNVRYRYEHSGQDGFDEDAHASTLRTRLGYETGAFKGLSALLEFENVTTLGPNDFNDTINGRTQFPVVADPEATEVNRAQVSYAGVPDTRLVAGRQRISLDNQRFVGAVGFRQNEQTFDAARFVTQSLPDVTASYAYVWQVNRIFGPDSDQGRFDSDTHLVNIAYDGLPFLTAVGYAYLVDLEEAPQLSSQSLGVRLLGRHALSETAALTLTGEYARQSDYGGNAGDFGLDYFLVEGRAEIGRFSAKAGYESLEGDGTNAFQTPLATLHAFQGLTDVFLVTPPDGIEEVYVSTSYGFGDLGLFRKVSVNAVYNDFSAENTSQDLGREWSVLAKARLFDQVGLSAQYASYDGGGFAADRDRLWLTVSFAL